MSIKKVCICMPEHHRTVGERGQVTIPRELRDQYGIEGGDEIDFIDTANGIWIRPPSDDERLAEGYQERSDRSKQLAEEMEPASAEANQYLGDPPEPSE